MDFKIAFILENGFDPKNPLDADKGLGCTEEITWCLSKSINASLDLALLPQSTNIPSHLAS